MFVPGVRAVRAEKTRGRTDGDVIYLPHPPSTTINVTGDNIERV